MCSSVGFIDLVFLLLISGCSLFARVAQMEAGIREGSAVSPDGKVLPGTA
jgi:hypothetical protein